MTERLWAKAITARAASPASAATLIDALGRVEDAGLPFCRLVERWRRGEAQPVTVDERRDALRAAARAVELALETLEEPLGQYLLELEPEAAEGQSWFGEAGGAELVDWAPVLKRAGITAEPHRVATVYLELAVLVRALEGLNAAVEIDATPSHGSLWAGLFDLRENLVGRLEDDLRALSI